MAYNYTTSRPASLGSISSGTLRTADLLEAFAGTLETLLGKQATRFPRKWHRSLIRDARRYIRDGEVIDGKENEALGALDALASALGEFSPPLAYFGTHEGDGADFGFWVSRDGLDEFDGLRVSDTSEVPASYRGEVLHVNDHGNCTLYAATAPGKLHEIWGIV